MWCVVWADEFRLGSDRARAGHSTAINISDVDYREVHRGMVVSEPGFFSGSSMFEARLHYLPDNHRPLIHQTSIRLHVGTAEALGKIFLLDTKKLDPGEVGFVQFRLDEPVVAAPGDRYVLRLHSPMLTIGGGEILDRSKFRLKTGKDYVLEDLRSKHAVLGDAEAFLLNHVRSIGFDVITEKDLALRAGMPLEDVRKLLETLIAKGLVQPASRAGLLLSTQRLDAGVEAARDVAKSYFEKNPLRLLHDKSQLRQQLECHDVFLEDLLARLKETGEVESVEAGRIRWSNFGPRLSDAEKTMLDEIRRECLDGKFSPPTPSELAGARAWPAETTTRLFDLLDEEGALQKLADGIYFHRDAVESAKSCLREFLEEKREMTASEARNALGSTRKYSIPLLEQLDKEGFTVRRGDVRALAENSS